MVKIVPQEICNKIEALQYEVESRKDLISYVLASGMNISGDKFDQYKKEYLEFYKQYSQAKQEMADKYIGKNTEKMWNLEFKTGELTIED